MSVKLIIRKGGCKVKKIFLMFFSTLLFINSFSAVNYSVAAQSFTDEVKTRHYKKDISPTGAWFTEDDELP